MNRRRLPLNLCIGKAPNVPTIYGRARFREVRPSIRTALKLGKPVDPIEITWDESTSIFSKSKKGQAERKQPKASSSPLLGSVHHRIVVPSLMEHSKDLEEIEAAIREQITKQHSLGYELYFPEPGDAEIRKLSERIRLYPMGRDFPPRPDLPAMGVLLEEERRRHVVAVIREVKTRRMEKLRSNVDRLLLEMSHRVYEPSGVAELTAARSTWGGESGWVCTLLQTMG